MAEPTRILIVDDDVMQLELLERSLRLDGFAVTTASSPIGVGNLLRSLRPHIVLLDVNLPGLTGDRLLTVVKGNAPEKTRFVLFSADDETKLHRLAKETGAHGWLSKSNSLTEISRRLKEMIEGTVRPQR